MKSLQYYPSGLQKSNKIQTKITLNIIFVYLCNFNQTEPGLENCYCLYN